MPGKSKEEQIDTSNIFEEFNDPSLNKEVNELIRSQKKDIYFYIEKIGHYLQYFLWGALFILGVLYGYMYIQENEDLYNNSFIDPFCFIISGDINSKASYCSSVFALDKEFRKNLTLLKDNQLTDINSIIESIYKLENFKSSKDIIFLTKKSDSKLPVLDILDEFDKLKNEFESIEKDKIKCFNIDISNEYVLKATCEAYSSGFDKEIKGFDGTDNKLIGGKSMSYANSFLNFIEKQSKMFSHINLQKIFTEEDLVGEKTGFTNKTQFNIELQYQANNLF